jgi:hypothetical protein
MNIEIALEYPCGYKYSYKGQSDEEKTFVVDLKKTVAFKDLPLCPIHGKECCSPKEREFEARREYWRNMKLDNHGVK